jgi:hypothetical protein
MESEWNWLKFVMTGFGRPFSDVEPSGYTARVLVLINAMRSVG